MIEVKLPVVRKTRIWWRLRRLFFWLHLLCGVLAGMVIFLMAITGALLSYQNRILSFADSRSMPSTQHRTGESRIPLSQLIEQVQISSGSPVTAVSISSNLSQPVVVEAGRDRVYLADPYSGKVVGPVSPHLRDFYRTITGLHRWFGLSGRSRETVRMIKGGCTLVLLVLAASGLMLWLPRYRSWRQMRSVLVPRWQGTLRARLWNWHNVAGAWAALPLMVIALTGVIMAFPWANSLLFRIAGTPVSQGSKSGHIEGTSTSIHSEGEKNLTVENCRSCTWSRIPANLDQLFAIAEGRQAEWYTITLRLSETPSPVMSFVFSQGDGAYPQFRDQLILDAVSGKVIRWEPFVLQPKGRRWRLWVRYLHTGEALGWVGQTLAALASVSAALLVMTGLFLSDIRFQNWRRKR